MPVEMSHRSTLQRRVSQRDTLALILAGGNGSRLGSLTQWQCKPALPFAGVYRNIDFSLSNCINSGIRRIAVLTQYKAHSLLHHITRAWGFLRPELGEFIEVWPAQQRQDDNWYLGTANAITQNLDLVLKHAPSSIIVLAGDHVYKMDYSQLLAFHQQNEAQVTVGSIEVPLDEVRHFGIMETSAGCKIRRFIEKPESAAPMPGRADVALASMGIYVFDTAFLLRALQADAANSDSTHDFGQDVLPWIIDNTTAAAYAVPFCDPPTGKPGYWRDVGNVDTYWQANIDLLCKDNPLDLYDPDWPMLPAQQGCRPTRFSYSVDKVPGIAIDSLVSGGCVIEGATVDHCVLSENVYVGPASILQDSIIFPGATIGARCRLKRVILSEDCHVPDGSVVGIDTRLDRLSFEVSDGGVALMNNESLQRQAMSQKAVA